MTQAKRVADFVSDEFGEQRADEPLGDSVDQRRGGRFRLRGDLLVVFLLVVFLLVVFLFVVFLFVVFLFVVFLFVVFLFVVVESGEDIEVHLHQ